MFAAFYRFLQFSFYLTSKYLTLPWADARHYSFCQALRSMSIADFGPLAKPSSSASQLIRDGWFSEIEALWPGVCAATEHCALVALVGLTL